MSHDFFNVDAFRLRCEFELTESGDVNWYPSEPGSTLAKNLPLFTCRTFEVLREREGLSVVINLRFGAYRGHILEFRVINERKVRKRIPRKINSLIWHSESAIL